MTENAKSKKNYTDSDSNQAIESEFNYLVTFSKLILENEEKRENSLIQQSSHMLTAISFMSASILIIAEIVFNLAQTISKNVLLCVFSSIIFFLLLSFILTTIAQYRYKRADFPDIETLYNYVKTKSDAFVSDAQQSKYFVETLSTIQKSYASINERRRMFLNISTNFLYITIALCFIWFVVLTIFF